MPTNNPQPSPAQPEQSQDKPLLRSQGGLGLMRSWLNQSEPTPEQQEIAQQIALKAVQQGKAR